MPASCEESERRARERITSEARNQILNPERKSGEGTVPDPSSIVPEKSRPQAGLLGAAMLFLMGSAVAQQISVYYYPWYAGANWNQSAFLRGANVMNIPPLIGTYDNATNRVSVRQHVEWSTNFGIDNWICSWWGPGTYQSNAILNNVAPNLAGTNVTFCLFYETSTFYNGRWTFGPSEIQLFHDHIQYMRDNFFSHPNYWKINGRPVVVVYLSRLMMGSYAAALDSVRKDFNVFMIGDDFHFGGPEPDRHRHWDAITIYNSHGLLTYNGYPQTTGFIAGARQNLINHKNAAAPYGTKLMSNVIPGYNDRAVRLATNNYPIPRRVAADSAEGSTFNQMLDMGIQVGDSVLGTAICSWNEWWEDSEIEPTVVSPPTNADGTVNHDYSKGYYYEGYGATLLNMLLARAGRNANVAPSLTLLQPASNNAWTIGSAQTITWSHGGTIYYVNLDYWNGNSWVRIATQIDNTGTRNWTVVANAALPVNIRVSTVEGVTFSTATATPVTSPSKFSNRPRIQTFAGSVFFDRLEGIRKILIIGPSGRLEQKLVVNANGFHWDTRNHDGVPVSPGVYQAVFAGISASFSKPLAIIR